MSSKEGLVPKLRFPAFKDAEAWGEIRLGDVFHFHSTATNSRADLSSDGGAFYVHYGDIHTKFHRYVDFSKDSVPRISLALCPNATLMKNGDLVLADASEDTNGIAKSVEVLGVTRGLQAIAGLHTFLLRDPAGIYAAKFKGLLFETRSVKAQVIRVAAGVKVYSVSKASLRDILLPAPSKPEQQKIAGCLSSLDDFIAAQANKVEALTSYKKSLMQRLFPAEDETVPRLRFPEFRSEVAWKEMPVGSLVREVLRPVEMDDGQDYSLVTVKRRYGGVETRQILKGGAIKVKSQFLIKKDDFLISKRQIVHCACGVVPMELENSIVSNEYSVLEATSQCDMQFFWYFAQQPKVGGSFLAASRGIVIEKMLFDLDYWLKMKFLFPHLAEQRKIGTFLATIDGLIGAHIQKLKALNAHKKGLMQRLFPSMTEGEA